MLKVKISNKVGNKKVNSFGSEMIIVEYRRYNDIDIYFPKYNWTAKNTTYSNFNKGLIKCPYEPRTYNKGCIGEGKYLAKENGKDTDVYKCWHSMLQRCYDKKVHNIRKTYEKCIVCDEWLNFQDFAEWYNENYYNIDNEIMHLDKDILVKNNKMYSPDTCVFVPQRINALFTKSNSKRGKYPIGVSIKENGKFQVQCHINGKNHKIGYYNTIEEAFNAYKNAKENEIKRIADQYKYLIPDNLYIALYNYEIDIND